MKECKHDYVYEPMDNWWACLDCGSVADSETAQELRRMWRGRSKKKRVDIPSGDPIREAYQRRIRKESGLEQY